MEVLPINPDNNDLSAITPAGGDDLGREEFLLLLTTQLSNQDPLNPMDGQEFAAQLAQFSSLEQLININDVLAQNGELNGLLAQSINSGVAAGLIGKEVEAVGNTFSIKADESAELHYNLGDFATNVTIEILNEAGVVVRTVELANQAEGSQSFEWDGKNDSGQALQGDHSFRISASDAEGESIATQPLVRGIAERITFGPEGILVWIGERGIPLGEIQSIGESN